MSNLTRQYHGCQIVSTQVDFADGDGWTHQLTRDGVDLGSFPTLAKAIAEARRVNAGEEPTYTPLASTSPVEPITEQSDSADA